MRGYITICLTPGGQVSVRTCQARTVRLQRQLRDARSFTHVRLSVEGHAAYAAVRAERDGSGGGSAARKCEVTVPQ